MDLTTYVEFDGNEISEDHFESSLDSSSDNVDINKERNDDDVFARRRARGAFTYFSSAVF